MIEQQQQKNGSAFFIYFSLRRRCLKVIGTGWEVHGNAPNRVLKGGTSFLDERSEPRERKKMQDEINGKGGLKGYSLAEKQGKGEENRKGCWAKLRMKMGSWTGGGWWQGPVLLMGRAMGSGWPHWGEKDPPARQFQPKLGNGMGCVWFFKNWGG